MDAKSQNLTTLSSSYSSTRRVQTLSQIPALSLPELAPAQTSLTIPHDPLPFPELPRVGESSAAGSPSIDPRRILDALASSVKIQAATSLDPQTLRKWFQRDWSVQIAVDDCKCRSSLCAKACDLRAVRAGLTSRALHCVWTAFVGASPYGASSSSSENEDLLKFTSATGSQAARDNVSSTSFTQSGISPCDREAQVGVEDFRQALGAGLYVHTNGRSGGSTGSNASQDGTSPTTTKAERHASRRASRKVNAPAGGAAGVGGLLDSMRVGMSEANEPIEAHR